MNINPKYFAMSKNFFTKLIPALVITLVAGLTACNKEDVDYDTPLLKVDKTELNFDSEGNSLNNEDSFSIETNREWTISIPDAGKNWIRLSSNQGNGNATVKVAVLASTEDRTVQLKLTSGINYEYINIKQTSGTVVEAAIYSEDGGSSVEKVNNKWPYVDEFTGWSRKGSLDQSAVKYSGQGANVSNSGAAFKPAEGSSISGAPYVGMSYSATAPLRYFVIEKINVTGKTNLTFKFASLLQSGYSGGPQFGEITSETFNLSGSINGTDWTDITYTAKNDAAGGNWYIVTSEFKVPEGTTELYIKIATSSLQANQGTRIDDFILSEGGNGTIEIGGNTTTVTTVTTTSASNVTATSADLGGTYTAANGVIFDEVGVSYKMSTSDSFSNVKATNVSTPFSVSVSELTTKTEYTYKAYAKIGEVYYYGSEMKFTTSDSTTTPPTEETAQNLFNGSDFENWDDFVNSLNSFGLQSYATKSTDGRNGSNGALYLNGTPKGNDYVFTASLSEDITIASPTKITFYIKGTSAKSLSLNIYRTDGKSYDVFNLETYTDENTALKKANLNTAGNGTNAYIGTIDTKGKWMKVTLDVTDVDINKAANNLIFGLKVGKSAAYDLLIDDITIQ